MESKEQGKQPIDLDELRNKLTTIVENQSNLSKASEVISCTSTRSNFVSSLLQIVFDKGSSTKLQRFAGVLFRNFMKDNWVSNDDLKMQEGQVNF